MDLENIKQEKEEVTEEIKSEVEDVNKTNIPNKPKSKLNFKWVWLAVTVIILAVVGVLIFNLGGFSKDLVATFNGGEIERTEFEKTFSQFSETPQVANMDLENPDVLTDLQEKILDDLISAKLILQKAEENSIEVSSEALDLRYDQVLTQAGGEEGLAKELSEFGVTMDELRDDLKDQIVIETYIGQTVDESSLTVSEEEIVEFHTTVSETDESMPPLEEIREQIKAFLQNQKFNQATNDLIEGLRTDANVKTFL